MAELKTTCIEGICYDVPEYEAGNGITITGSDPKIISADVDLSDYYNKTEIDDIVSAIEVGGFKEVDTLPTVGDPNYIYLVPKTGGGYNRYIYSDGQWLDLGDTDTVYSAGRNIEITSSNVINSLIQSGTNITVGNDGKVSLNTSPALTGTPTAPTNGNAATSNTQIATTAFVQNAINRRLTKNILNVSKSNVALTSGTPLKQNMWTAPSAGVVIVTGYANFNANTAGARYLQFYKKTGSNYAGLASGIRVGASQSGSTILTATCAEKVASGEIITIELYQNSGGNLSVSTCNVRGVFIPD